MYATLGAVGKTRAAAECFPETGAIAAGSVRWQLLAESRRKRRYGTRRTDMEPVGIENQGDILAYYRRGARLDSAP
jgi:hypothetical protein